jgi:hypothetical protein
VIAEMNSDSVRAQPHHGVDQSAARLGFLAECELALRHVFRTTVEAQQPSNR